MNKVILIGNLGRDAELRYTQGGDGVATFNLATSKKFKDRSGDMQERTEWHRCVLWGKRAEALNQYLTKGSKLMVEGELQTRKWTDKDGHDRYTTEIRVAEVELLGGGRDREEADGGGRQRRTRRQEHGPEPEPQGDEGGDTSFDPGSFGDEG